MSVLVHFSTMIHVESANHSNPTMTAIVAMGYSPNHFKHMGTIQFTLLLIEEAKSPNKINCNNQKSCNTVSST